jgi:cation diffusion facilitator family transporter
MSRTQAMLMALLIGILLMVIKFIAWYLTGSNAILTDALESIINVVAGGFALYSLYYSAKPRDEDHPYGHGKIEFFSAGLEGSLIFLAGTAMVVKAVYGFFQVRQLLHVDIGLYLSAFTAAVNFFVGRYLVTLGRKTSSATLIADGKHLLSDTISTVGLVAGLLVIYFTKLYWLDNIITLALGGWIIFMGFKLVRESVSNLLDETDTAVVESIIKILGENRRDNWIDIHNLRVLKYGARLHIDCHLTLPYYLTLLEAHDEVHAVENLVKEKTENEVELFIHADPCLPPSCTVCSRTDCKVRKQEFIRRTEWNLRNVLPDKKHSAELG